MPLNGLPFVLKPIGLVAICGETKEPAKILSTGLNIFFCSNFLSMKLSQCGKKPAFECVTCKSNKWGTIFFIYILLRFGLLLLFAL